MTEDTKNISIDGLLERLKEASPALHNEVIRYGLHLSNAEAKAKETRVVRNGWFSVFGGICAMAFFIGMALHIERLPDFAQTSYSRGIFVMMVITSMIWTFTNFSRAFGSGDVLDPNLEHHRKRILSLQKLTQDSTLADAWRIHIRDMGRAMSTADAQVIEALHNKFSNAKQEELKKANQYLYLHS